MLKKLVQASIDWLRLVAEFSDSLEAMPVLGLALPKGVGTWRSVIWALASGILDEATFEENDVISLATVSVEDDSTWILVVALVEVEAEMDVDVDVEIDVDLEIDADVEVGVEVDVEMNVEVEVEVEIEVVVSLATDELVVVDSSSSRVTVTVISGPELVTSSYLYSVTVISASGLADLPYNVSCLANFLNSLLWLAGLAKAQAKSDTKSNR